MESEKLAIKPRAIDSKVESAESLLAEVELQVSTARGAPAGVVAQAVTPLFATFGYQVPGHVIDELTAKTRNYKISPG